MAYLIDNYFPKHCHTRILRRESLESDDWGRLEKINGFNPPSFDIIKLPLFFLLDVFLFHLLSYLLEIYVISDLYLYEFMFDYMFFLLLFIVIKQWILLVLLFACRIQTWSWWGRIPPHYLELSNRSTLHIEVILLYFILSINYLYEHAYIVFANVATNLTICLGSGKVWEGSYSSYHLCILPLRKY